MKTNWEKLCLLSDYLTIRKIKNLLDEKKYADVSEGLEIYFLHITLTEQNDSLDVLQKLMELILLWKTDKKFQTGEIMVEIENTFEDLEWRLNYIPCITAEFLKSKWTDIFKSAKIAVEAKLNQKCLISELSWSEVFENQYVTEYARKQNFEKTKTISQMTKNYVEKFQL